MTPVHESDAGTTCVEETKPQKTFREAYYDLEDMVEELAKVAWITFKYVSAQCVDDENAVFAVQSVSERADDLRQNYRELGTQVQPAA